MTKRHIAWIGCLFAVAALMGCTREDRKARLLAQADRDLAAGRRDEAEAEYKNVLVFPLPDPDGRRTEAIRQLGFLYQSEGLLPPAVAYLKRAAELSPESAEVQAALAGVYLEMGSAEDGLAAAKRALELDGHNEAALVALAEASATDAEAEAARRLVQMLTKRGPDCAGYHVALAILDLNRRDTSGGKAELTKALELDPNSADAYFEWGALDSLSHDVKGARDALAKAAELSALRSPIRLRYIDFLLATGRTAEAKRSLGELTTAAPDFVPGLVLAMKLALTDRRFADCDRLIEGILARDHQNIEALLAHALVTESQGDSAGALTELERADAIQRASPQLKFELGRAYFRAGDLSRAEDRLNQAIVLAPNFEPAELLLAEVQLRLGNSTPAISTLIELLRRGAAQPKAYLLLAAAFADRGDPEQALAVYSRMAAVFPSDPEAPYDMAVLLARQRRGAEARQKLEETLRLNPDFEPAVDMLVDADVLDGRFDAAKVRIAAQVAAHPQLAAPWLLQAKLDLAQRDVKATEADLVRATLLEPKAEPAYLQLAQLYLATGREPLAVNALSDLAKRTGSEAALLRLAAIYAGDEKFAQARGAYERLLAADPKFVPALNNLANLYAEHLGSLDRALELANRARSAAPQDPDVMDSQGWIRFERGDYAGALDPLRQSVRSAPGNPETHFHLGMTEYMLGEEVPAGNEFHSVIQSAAPRELAAAARDRLAILDIDPATASDGAAARLRTELDREPNDPVVRVRLAAIEARSGDGAQAAADYEAALKALPKSVPVLVALVQLYSGSLQNFERARDLAKQAHELVPNDPKVALALGRMLYRMGDYKWSLDLLEQAAQTGLGRSALAFELARAYYSVGRMPEAQAALRMAEEPGAPASQRQAAERLATMISAITNPAAAPSLEPEARAILAATPGDIPASMVCALASESRGNVEEARQIYERIVDKDPVFAPAERQLAILYAERLGRDAQAEDLALRARESLPNDSQLAYELGVISYRRADYPDAVKYLRQSVADRPQDAATFFYLGMAHYEIDETDAAKAELERALALHVGEAQADQARRTLKEIGQTRKPGF